MKSLRLMTTMLLLAVFGTMYAEQVTFSSASDKGDELTTITKDGITIKTNNGYVNELYPEYRFYKNSKTTITSTVGNITKIEFTCTAANTSQYGPGSWSNEGDGEYTYSEKNGTWTGNTSEVTFNASGNQVRVTEIIVTYNSDASNKEDVTMSFPESSYSVNMDMANTFNAPSLTTIPTVSGISYSSSDPMVATVDEVTGEVTLVGGGTTEITANFAGNETYNPASASYTLSVLSSINISTLTFTKECNGTGLADDGASWTVTSDANESVYDEVKGVHYGTNSKKVSYITLQTSEIPGTITKIVVNAASANASTSTPTTVTATVNGAEFGSPVTITEYNYNNTAECTFEGSATGAIVVKVEKTYSTKALYVKSITVYYTPESDNKVTVTIGQSKYASLYYENQALVVPQGVEAYTYKLNGDKVEASYMYDAGETIPAGTAVILKGEPNDYSFAFSTETGDVDSENILKGTDSDTPLEADANSYFYKLSLNAAEELSSIGFYWGAADGAAFTNNAHKAYLKVAKSAGAKFYRFDGETTAIENVQAAQPDANAPMYNVAGQRVSKNYKGVVIQNGRKYVVK